MRLVGGDGEMVIKFVETALGKEITRPAVAFGIIDDKDILIGGAVFNDYTGNNIEMTLHCRGLWARPNVLQSIAHYVYEVNGCERLTARTRRGNIAVRKLLPKAGFSFEGTQKRYFGKSKEDDALLFVLFRDKAEKWMKTI